MRCGLRQAAVLATVAAVAGLAFGCASKPKPHVAVMSFTDTRQYVDPKIEKKYLFGDKLTIADYTTDAVAREIEKAGYDVVVVRNGAAPDGVDAVVEGTVYRWEIVPVQRLMHYDATAIARSSVTVTKKGGLTGSDFSSGSVTGAADDSVVINGYATGDDTEVHASEMVLNPLYDPSAQPLRVAAENMADEIASKVVASLEVESTAEAEAPSETPFR
jgi:hypothetical protein